MTEQRDDTFSKKLRKEASELFKCSICLELVYKPVVQACGHMFCFWCSYQVMDLEKQSQCPLCRRPYMHFPRICQLLHLVLSKAVPQEYKRRACEIQGEEEKHQIFSPCFPELQETSQLCQEITGPNSESSAAGSYASVLAADDFQCSACNDLLYRPVVLNCGDVFCETCLKKSNSKLLQCPSCKAPHPEGSPLICLELHQYLESSFPAEYLRKCLQTLEETSMPIDYNTADDGDFTKGGDLHEAVGCDGCGMFPIIGDRYHCEECTEMVGFDLCGSCYSSGGSLLGRFNQKHQLNHRMEQVEFSSFSSCTTGLNILQQN